MKEPKHLLSKKMFRAAFGFSGRPGLPKGDLVKLVAEQNKVGKSVVWRALGRVGQDGYAMQWLDEVAGIVALKK